MVPGLRGGVKAGLGAPVVVGRRSLSSSENVVLLQPNVAFDCSRLGGGSIIEAANSLFPISLPQIISGSVTVNEAITYLGKPTLDCNNVAGGFRGTVLSRNLHTPLAPTPFTFECWCRPTATAGTFLDGRGLNDSNQFAFFCNNLTELGVFDGVVTTIFSGISLQLEEWNHLALQWEPSAGNRSWRLYANGAMSTNSSPDRNTNTPSLTVTLGAHIANTSFPSFRGQLGQCAFWHNLRYEGSYTPPENIYTP
jgi:hypothetical protein